MTSTRMQAIGAVAIVAVAAVLRITDGASLDGLVPTLVATAGLLVAGLARRAAPNLASFSLGLGAVLGAIEAIAVIRAWLPETPPEDRTALVALAALVGIAATLVAWAFFLRTARSVRGPRRRALSTFVIVGLVAVAFVQAIVTAPTTAVVEAATADAVTPFRLATRLMLALAAGALLLGAVELVLSRLAGAMARTRGPAGSSWPDALGAEFAAGIGRRRAESERARLAADLHATVVPALRSAATTADPQSGARVREALEDVEQLMASRHSVVLERFGLVAALEWLAERTQQRAGIEVTLDVDPASTDDRPPEAVERAAFRVALLAVDNAVRHAPGSPVAIELLASKGRVAVAVHDAGPGFDAGAAVAPGEHRGLADMRFEAGGIGASVSIKPGAPAGTIVAFAWPAR